MLLGGAGSGFPSKLKSANTSIRASRQPFIRSEVVDDFKVNNFILANPFCDCNFVFKLTEYEISVKKRDV